ncbi:HAMP domain-containing histidine kinase [Paenibacillus sp. P26]|nr:HAMP domain-containing histidine kinase [Paenibacillus sp. P26]UUZ92333.1 HAMP domain-containing histidine kinase [Paenibacillus sp. P25]
MESASGLLIQLLSTWMAAFFIELLLRNHKLREEVLQMEKLKVISDLAASVSHEVRNPMTVSKGFLQLLQNGKRDEQEKRFLKLALEELERAEAIITDYLAFAKPEPDRVAGLDVKEEIGYVTGVLQPYAAMAQVDIELRCEEGRSVWGDRQKFRQCLVNLMKNAIEAMPDGGMLHVESALERKNIVIRIQDTGHGMTQEEVRRLGTPYYTTKDKGTGLGTMVAFSIVKAMNGKVHVSSEKEAGTLFTITLPAQF